MLDKTSGNTVSFHIVCSVNDGAEVGIVVGVLLGVDEGWLDGSAEGWLVGLVGFAVG